MSQSESPRACSTGASDQQVASPQRNAHQLTSAESVIAIAARDEAAYLRRLLAVLDRTSYGGRDPLNGLPYFVERDDHTRRRILLARRGLRHLAGPDVSATVLARLVGDLEDLAREVEDVAIMRAIDLACDLEDDLDDAEAHLRTLEDHDLGPDVDAALRRHPAGRTCTAGRVR